MLGVVAAAVEPIAGGRHKVFGRKELAILPMTSTIASHLPRAVGMALAIDRAARLGVSSPWKPDGIVLCSFGDASLNHATAQAALNTTAQIAFQGLPLPLLYVCEDNGLGISVPSPAGWVESALTARKELRYEIAYGHDPGRGARHRDRARGVGARAAATGGPAPALRALPQPCGRRCGDGVSHAAGDPRRLREGPDPRHGALARLRWPRDGRGARRRLPGRTRRGARARARGRGASADDLGGAGDGARWRPRSSAVVAEKAARRSTRLGGAADARAGDQRRPRRGPRAAPERSRFRRGHRSEGRCLRRDARAARAIRRGAGLRHAARRDLDPRPRARRGGQRVPPDPRDPVPRIPPQRRGPAPRRGVDPPVLLAARVPERDGDPDRRLRLPARASEGISTTTTRSACCATSPASSSPRRRGPTMPPRCS